MIVFLGVRGASWLNAQQEQQYDAIEQERAQRLGVVVGKDEQVSPELIHNRGRPPGRLSPRHWRSLLGAPVRGEHPFSVGVRFFRNARVLFLLLG